MLIHQKQVVVICLEGTQPGLVGQVAWKSRGYLQGQAETDSSSLPNNYLSARQGEDFAVYSFHAVLSVAFILIYQ